MKKDENKYKIVCFNEINDQKYFNLLFNRHSTTKPPEYDVLLLKNITLYIDTQINKIVEKLNIEDIDKLVLSCTFDYGINPFIIDYFIDNNLPIRLFLKNSDKQHMNVFYKNAGNLDELEEIKDYIEHRISNGCLVSKIEYTNQKDSPELLAPYHKVANDTNFVVNVEKMKHHKKIFANSRIYTNKFITI